MALTILRTFSVDLLHFVFPPLCTLCGDRLAETDQIICDRCREEMPGVLEPICRNCGQTVRQGTAMCGTCRKVKPAFDCARSVAAYSGPAEQIVKELKYHEHLELAPVMARLLFVALERMLPFDPVDAVVPVPLHAGRLRERGFNQAECLAAPLAELLGQPMLPDVVARVRPTQTQTLLSLKERVQNLQDAFEPTPGASERVRDKNLLLIDDVCTTGITGSACAAALKKAGAARVVLLTFARAILEKK